MGWKKNNRQPKQSISSVTSMSFLTDPNLTFHRFSDGTITSDGQKSNGDGKQSVWTTRVAMDYSTTNPTLEVNENDTSTAKIIPDDVDDSLTKRYSTYSSTCNNSTTSTHPQHNGSTLKLIQVQKDDNDRTNKQSRCSIFRGVIFCLCMNLTYANIVRFPRELERHGIAFLVPYLLIMLVIGMPIVLLEIALGQFLGQGSAHSWKASPFFKGASVVGRLGSWLGTVWTSMQMALALLYIGQMSFTKVPFAKCPTGLKIIETRYKEDFQTGQMCLPKTFLRPLWENSLPFGMLAIGLIFLWVIVMLCTHSSRINRRSIFMFGFITITLLLFQTGWQVTSTIQHHSMPEIWPFRLDIFQHSSTWFYALIQVIFSTNIGVGAIPVMTGKFLYKGDAVRTCFVYISFNLLICIIATAYYMTTFSPLNGTAYQTPTYPDLTTLTSIYDQAFAEPYDSCLRSLIPSLAYLMIIFAGITSISMAIYTSSRLHKRHPNYVMCMMAMFVAIGCLIAPHFVISRMLDMQWVGVVIICAIIFDVISIAWIYGSKSLYNDLEFSIGRPIFKLWLVLWTLMPLILTGILAWWIAVPAANDSVEDLIPRWIPIVVCVVIIIIFAVHEVSKQMDYNLCSQIHESTRPAKDWGPADPLVRHAWKQWKTVCDDTGERDFTLRRRGTKDWTNSIKKGQYSHAKNNTNNNNKYLNGSTKQITTTGSNSPNYSGSVFGDSAIEEDISVEKYNNQMDFPHDSRSRRSSTNTNYKRQMSDASSQQRPSYLYHQNDVNMSSNYHNQKIPIRVPSRRDPNGYMARIEILPPVEPAQFQAPVQSSFMVKNPLGHFQDVNFLSSTPFNGNQFHPNDYQPRGHLINNIHIESSEGSGTLSTKTTNTGTQHGHEPWRKISRNSDEFSTEL